MTLADTRSMVKEIAQFKWEKNALILAHYYQVVGIGFSTLGILLDKSRKADKT